MSISYVTLSMIRDKRCSSFLRLYSCNIAARDSVDIRSSSPFGEERDEAFFYPSMHTIIKKYTLFLSVIVLVFCITSARAQDQFRREQFTSIDTLLLLVSDTTTLLKTIDGTHGADKRNPDSAATVYRRTKQLSRSLGSPLGLARSLIYVGNIYSEQGMYDSALSNLKEAISLCLETPDFGCYLPGLYNSMACIYQYQYNYGEAAKYLYKACFDGHKPSPDFSIAGVYNNMSFILSRVGRPQQAFFYLDKAEQMARAGKKQEMLLSGILLNKATIYIDEGKTDSGVDYLHRSLAISEAANILVLRKVALINLGNVYMVAGDSKKALGYFLQAKELKGHINPVYENAGNAMLGGCYCTLKRYDLGFPIMLSALAQAEQLHLGQNIININRMLAECYALKKDYKNALQYNLAFTHLKDSIENKERDKMVSRYEVKYRTSEKSKQLAEKELLITRQAVHLRNKNLLMGGAFALALVLGTLAMAIYRTYKSKELLQEKQIEILQQSQKIGQFKAVMEGEEKERSRIARELHDGLGGMMAAVKMNFSILQNQYEDHSGSNTFIRIDEFREIQDMLDEVNNEIRRTAYNLMPDILAMHGIAEALRMYVEPINAFNQLYINLQINGEAIEMDNFFELSLYRIIQELIQNILKHSEATNCLVQLTFTDDMITLLVKDNGKGFDHSVLNAGLGLQNVQFRVHSFKGTITTTSSASTGTSVLIVFDDFKRHLPS